AAMSVVFGFVMLAAGAGLLLSYYPDCARTLLAEARRAYARDTLVGLVAAVGLALFVHMVEVFLQNRFHAQALFSISSPDLLANAAPALAAIAGALRIVILYSAIVGTVALIADYARKRWQLAVLSLAAIFVLVPAGVRTPG